MKVNWKVAGLNALIGVAAVGAGFVAQKKFRSTPAGLAAGAAVAMIAPWALLYTMDKLGMAGLVMENVSGLVMESVSGIPELRSRSALGDYRGLVMENVAGLYDYYT
jgi:hypothetical protein